MILMNLNFNNQNLETMSEIILKKNIRGYLFQLSDYVAKNTAKGLFDINKTSEATVAELLNETFGYNLETKDEDPRFPGVDLVDTCNKITVQVTSTTTSTKVKNTCITVIKEEYYKIFNRLIFYYITNKSVNVTNILKANVHKILGTHIGINYDTDFIIEVCINS